MKQFAKIFLLTVLLFDLNFVQACSIVLVPQEPGTVADDAYKIKEAELEYRTKINSPLNFYEFPATGPLGYGEFSTYKILKESEKYSLFWVEPDPCFTRGLYVKNFVAYGLIVLMYVVSLLIAFKSINEISKKKAFSKAKATFLVVLYFLVLSLVLALQSKAFFSAMSSVPGTVLLASFLLIAIVSSLRSVDQENASIFITKKVISCVLLVVYMVMYILILPALY